MEFVAHPAYCTQRGFQSLDEVVPERSFASEQKRVHDFELTQFILDRIEEHLLAPLGKAQNFKDDKYIKALDEHRAEMDKQDQ